MDKNHATFENFQLLEERLIPSSSHLFFYENAFSKIKLIQEITLKQNLPVLYLDLDLLFSGYVKSKILTIPNLTLFSTLDSKINEILPKIFTKLTIEPHLVIFDSINGLYNTLSNDADSGRLVNAILMLLAKNISFSSSILIIFALAGKKENDWVLPNGRQILENAELKKFTISDRSKITFEK
ncbi:hypothetical protein OAJ08_02685 [Candidatus Nitrosopelagicus sp.]|nr:hypothetical protein [Candidatus Nitrosopelagicus sp.]